MIVVRARKLISEPKSPAVVASSAQVEYFVWDEETQQHSGPFTRSQMVEKALPDGTNVCISDGKGGFGVWQDVTELIAPPHQMPREEEAYRDGSYGAAELTRQESAAAAARLRKQSSVNERAKAVASRMGGAGS